MDCFASSGAHSRDPLARNDDCALSSLPATNEKRLRKGALLSAEARLRAKADATKQSILSLRLDGLLRFIGRAFARPVRSQ
jgi:hypothetical protein